VTDAKPTCPKCAGEMQSGFVLDRNRYVESLGEWAVGEPRSNGWGGFKLPTGRRFPIRGVRCEGCGFVELYARRIPHQPSS
jgi:hypothetical protein